MAWVLLGIPVTGTIATVAGWATKVVNNFRYLKGIDGVVTTQSGLEIDNTLGSEYLKLPLLSTAETGTVLAAEGKVAFDEQTHAPKYHNGTAVKQINLLSDCDIASAAEGDILYRGASAWSRLAKGTASQYLQMNGGATAPQWSTGLIATGIITIWAGTIANIPTGWVICDGNNSTPNLLTKFLEGVTTAATNPGTTGGATTKYLDQGGGEVEGGIQLVYSPVGHGSLVTTVGVGTGAKATSDTITDIRPLFYDVAFLMKT